MPKCSYCDSEKPIVWDDVDGKKECSECNWLRKRDEEEEKRQYWADFRNS
jgi:hypothetical protein